MSNHETPHGNTMREPSRQETIQYTCHETIIMKRATLHQAQQKTLRNHVQQFNLKRRASRNSTTCTAHQPTSRTGQNAKTCHFNIT